MRVLLCLGLAVLAGGCGGIRSGLHIEPGSTFRLGGEQRGAFRVDAFNPSGATVQILEITARRDTLAVVTLARGQSASARFAAGSAALLVNADSLEALLSLKITGDTHLGMSYSPDERRRP